MEVFTQSYKARDEREERPSLKNVLTVIVYDYLLNSQAFGSDCRQQMKARSK